MSLDGRRVPIGFDVDDTLVRVTERPIDYDDPADVKEKTVPIWEACLHVARLQREAGSVVFVTGRSIELEDLTVVQLLHGGVQDASRVHCQPEFTTLEDMTQWKAEVLEEQSVRLYVGDTVYDKRAAERAGSHFLWSQDFHSLIGAPRATIRTEDSSHAGTPDPAP